MTQSTKLTCRCGEVSLSVQGPHIMSVECLCTSCRTAAQMLEALPQAAPVLDSKKATPLVLHRKDRITFHTGQQHLKEHRLTPDAGTRRVVATCCNTPVFIELKGGHWLSLYAALWAQENRPAPEIRTMTGDLEDPGALPADIPNLKTHNLSFYGKLFGAWMKMGFRNPQIEVNGPLETAPDVAESA